MTDEMVDLEERWFRELTDEQRAAVLALDPEQDPPGWVVASLVAAHASIGGDTAADDLRAHVVERLKDLIRRHGSGRPDPADRSL